MYNPLTDKEIIDKLELIGDYEVMCRIISLKRENANLKRKITNLTKKYQNGKNNSKV